MIESSCASVICFAENRGMRYGAVRAASAISTAPACFSGRAPTARAAAATARTSIRDAAPPRPTAAEAVRAVARGAEIAGRGNRHAYQRQRGAEQKRPHAGLHVTFERAPMPLRRIAAVKSTFPSAAAYAKK